MNQVLICLKNGKGNIKMDVLDPWRKELVAVGNSLRTGDLKNILRQVIKAKDAGATYEDIEMVVDFVQGNGQIHGYLNEKEKNNIVSKKGRKFVLKPEIENLKTCYTDEDLIALLNAVRSGDKHLIKNCIKKAFDSGATKKDIWNVLSEVIGDEQLLISTIEVLNLIHTKK